MYREKGCHRGSHSHRLGQAPLPISPAQMGQRGTGSADRCKQSLGLREIPSWPTWKVLRSNEAFSQPVTAGSAKPPASGPPDMPSPWGQWRHPLRTSDLHSRNQANMWDSSLTPPSPVALLWKVSSHIQAKLKDVTCTPVYLPPGLHHYHFPILEWSQWSISKSILFLWCIHSEIQISVHFLPNISACVSLTRAQNLYFSYVKFTQWKTQIFKKNLYWHIVIILC